MTGRLQASLSLASQPKHSFLLFIYHACKAHLIQYVTFSVEPTMLQN